MSSLARADDPPPRPNVVFIYADDLGYGDLGCYGSRIRTPNLDRMASEGALFGQFYSASPVCSPSRAALLTGRYPTRAGIPGALPSGYPSGLPDSETTIAQVLKGQGYSTKCIGKWHLGTAQQYLPTNRGFDDYFGIPYSNDMWPLPLMRNTDTVEQPANLETLTQRYTTEAVNYIAGSKGSPFFLYLAYAMPHIPLAASSAFKGRSPLGPYGDSVEEMDWSVGEVLRAVAANGLDRNTLVMFSSDNGPWYQGSPGTLRGRKGETYEGGMREPFIARLPGAIPAGRVVNSVASTLDILPTVARLAQAPLPSNPLDGIDIWPLLAGATDAIERNLFLYFNGWNVQCARAGKWKLHLSRYNAAVWSPDPACGRLNLPLTNPELYNLEADPEESYDVSRNYPQIVADIRARVEESIPTFPGDVQDAWRNTMSMQVQGTPTGALPIWRGQQ